MSPRITSYNVCYTKLLRAWFAVVLGSDGGIEDAHGWGESGSQALVNLAHGNGVKVHMTVVLWIPSNSLEQVAEKPDGCRIDQ